MHILKDFGVTKYVGKLKNGTRVVLFHKPSTPILTNALFKAGSRFDPKGKEGLAHFGEHVMFKKTEKFKSENDVSKFIESLGGEINAYTWVDGLGVEVEIATASDFEKSAVFVNELVQRSMFTKEQVDIERGVVLREINDQNSNPGWYIYTLAYTLMLQDTDAGRPVLGTHKTVRSIDYEDLKHYYKTLINPDDMTLIISGGVELGEVIDTYNNKFDLGEIDKKSKVERTILEINRKEEIRIEKYTDTEQVHLSLGFRTAPIYSHDSDALSVIRVILGHGMSSSLFRKLRTESGLVYSVEVKNSCSSDYGNFYIFSSTSKKDVNKVIKIIVSECNRMTKGDIQPNELLLAKDKIIKSKTRELQTSLSWVVQHYLDELYCPDTATDVADWMNRIEKVSIEDIARVAKKYFKPGSWYLALCGDIEEKDVVVDY